MTVWLPGMLVNPTNGSRGHWSKHSRWAKSWRDRACMQILAVVGASRHHGIDPTIPKVVTFTAHVGAEWDDDGLAASLKPVRDALQDMRIISNDRPSAGHRFVYEQVYPTPRASRGVRIDVVAMTEDRADIDDANRAEQRAAGESPLTFKSDDFMIGPQEEKPC